MAILKEIYKFSAILIKFVMWSLTKLEKKNPKDVYGTIKDRG